MCVPVPPSAGGRPKTAATTVDNSAPPDQVDSVGAPPAIDYSKYAGVSPFDVRTRMHANGLPTGFDWSQWMHYNPGAPDPRNHSNTGDLVVPRGQSQFTAPGQTPTSVIGSTAPRPPAVPAVPTTPAAPVIPTNPISAVQPTTPTSAVVPQGRQPTGIGTLVPTSTTPTNPIATTAAPADPGRLFAGTGNTSGNPLSGNTYRTDAAYSPGVSQLADTPVGSVTNALLRRFRGRDWVS